MIKNASIKRIFSSIIVNFTNPLNKNDSEVKTSREKTADKGKGYRRLIAEGEMEKKELLNANISKVLLQIMKIRDN